MDNTYFLKTALCSILLCCVMLDSTPRFESMVNHSDVGVTSRQLADGSNIRSSLENVQIVHDGQKTYGTLPGKSPFVISGGRHFISPAPHQTCGINDASTKSEWTITHWSSAGCRCAGTQCNCSSQGLELVPDDLPSNVTYVDLSNNKIKYLPPCAFCKYEQLTFLNLSNNGLEFIDEYFVINNSKLEMLDLQHNNISLNNSDTHNAIFSNLPSLRSLRLGKNKYLFTHFTPGEMLEDLKNLQELFMDGSKKNLKGLQNMNQLKHLTLEGRVQGNCRIQRLNHESFINLTQLIYLDISTCDIQDIFPNAFQPLQQLKSLNMSFNYFIRVKGLINLLPSLTYSDVTTLVVNYINPFYSRGVNIDKETIASLPVKLEHLEAAGNGFEVISHGALKYAPDNLRYVDLSNNRFIYGRYLEDLFHLKHLTLLKLSGEAVVPHLPDNYYKPPKFTLYERTSHREDDDTDYLDDDSDVSLESHPSLNITLPPNLQQIVMDSLSIHYVLTGINVDPKNALECLRLNDNIFPILQGPLIGLDKLQYLDLRYASINAMNRSFFQNLTGLKYLMLGTNKLRDFFTRYINGSHIFYDLKELKELDLSNNDLNLVPEEIFESLENLEQLYMDRSSMWQFNLSISHLINLKLVNLSHSQLSSLPGHVRRRIDKLCSRNGRGILFDLSFNPLQCDCDHLEFLSWMVKSCAFDKNFTNYMCKYPNEYTKTINDSYRDDLMTLRRACADNKPMFLCVLAATVCMLGFVVAGILYRYRWKIRYFYYAAYIKLKAKHAPLDKDNFRHDVFVSYAAKDEAFIMNYISRELSARGLKLLVHGRDFVVGDFIASNIVTAVRESRKTLVVLTRNLLASTWCSYELQMANMESVHTGRPVLVFLLKESIPNNELGRDLLYHIRNNTYILYPQNGENEMEVKVFWDKLARDLSL